MPKLLAGNAQKGWPYFQRLLVDLFQFMEPFLRNAELGEPVGLKKSYVMLFNLFCCALLFKPQISIHVLVFMC